MEIYINRIHIHLLDIHIVWSVNNIIKYSLKAIMYILLGYNKIFKKTQKKHGKVTKNNELFLICNSIYFPLFVLSVQHVLLNCSESRKIYICCIGKHTRYLYMYACSSILLKYIFILARYYKHCKPFSYTHVTNFQIQFIKKLPRSGVLMHH